MIKIIKETAERIRLLAIKHKEFIMYVFVGGLTTLVNYVSYIVMTDVFHCSTGVSTTVAWFASVAFAFAPNKLWVFKSRARGFSIVARELFAFFTARALSWLVDLGIMVLFVDHMQYNDKIIKILSNIFVILINYVASKLFIFRGKKEEESSNQ